MLENAGTDVINRSAPWSATMAGNTEDRHSKTAGKTGNIIKTTAFHRVRACVLACAPVFCVLVSNGRSLHV